MYIEHKNISDMINLKQIFFFNLRRFHKPHFIAWFYKSGQISLPRPIIALNRQSTVVLSIHAGKLHSKSLCLHCSLWCSHLWSENLLVV